MISHALKQLIAGRNVKFSKKLEHVQSPSHLFGSYIYKGRSQLHILTADLFHRNKLLQISFVNLVADPCINRLRFLFGDSRRGRHDVGLTMILDADSKQTGAVLSAAVKQCPGGGRPTHRAPIDLQHITNPLFPLTVIECSLFHLRRQLKIYCSIFRSSPI